MELKLADIIDKLLRYDQKYRDSDKELAWRVWEVTGFVKNGVMDRNDFMSAPSFKSITRARRNYQRSDRIRGNNLIQASKNTREHRSKLAKEKGQSFISAQPKYEFNRDTMQYEETR